MRWGVVRCTAEVSLSNIQAIARVGAARASSFISGVLLTSERQAVLGLPKPASEPCRNFPKLVPCSLSCRKLSLIVSRAA